jgi:hypothetical protein
MFHRVVAGVLPGSAVAVAPRADVAVAMFVFGSYRCPPYQRHVVG